MQVISQTPVLFAVAAVSSTTNSFGLRGHVLIAATGEAWELALSCLDTQPKGGRITANRVTFADGSTRLGFAAGEIPRRLSPDAPADVVASAWAVVPAEARAK